MTTTTTTTTTIQDLLEKQQQKKAQRRAQQSAAAASVTQTTNVLSDADKDAIQSLIQSHRVVVFSKTYCPYCDQAKMTLRSAMQEFKQHADSSGSPPLLPPETMDNVVIELDDGSHEGWQDYLGKLALSFASTNSIATNNNPKSVPQIVIDQKWIGGADDMNHRYTDKSLFDLLRIEG